ncbi:alternative ribosome rescue aminoacyl-tRNA hydrolase ArfB [Rivihabitans pingtungensis]|jgi:ribosome-associated protein|uniref:Ribosome-associated protein n=2 Tax=Rivihabitans pingtungensis TaxID=1054498 RepID=A0A318LFL0_9NEIS|nr:alternative ribosome rescue aminoacyl-tRNA hydrolase ArfB [Rivihabitans pingtungensis]MCK6437263.1 aminoacyl-tRNA hydrolase [Rivihabitans pingtungensis]PXX80397.1 ribosome-associated protein [Rivihabitans pingtungensis]HNX70767.1 alternative ribosome rescue aminoacyl-tRNA hydrolase ArfB [Rivihabitans pingtungensis]
MIPITRSLALADDEIEAAFTRAQGPGGQHVNTTDSAVQLRFDVRRSPSLPEPVKARLCALAGRRMTQDGVLLIQSQAQRSQALNRADALAKLVALIQAACQAPRPRKATRPTRASQTRRLDGKAKRGAVKQLRQRKPGHE